MRFTGTLKTWNDERGFGFIEPTQGGQELFVHIKAFPGGSGRPVQGQLLTFEVEVGPNGKKRAKSVRPPVSTRRAKQRRVESTAPWTLPRKLALPFLVVVYAYVVLHWGFQPRVPLVYGGASLLALFVYAFDKSAAVSGRWRTPESTLHLLAVAGGWPGALLAQQMLRHKTTKAKFVVVFWATVALNLAGLVIWHATGAANM
ncbi:MAG: DNA-binding protein [Burkholderiales bacterium PBB1]|nr:MAG: DNA-binding protein [Burkholderiales bacterium PBB1]